MAKRAKEKAWATIKITTRLAAAIALTGCIKTVYVGDEQAITYRKAYEKAIEALGECEDDLDACTDHINELETCP